MKDTATLLNIYDAEVRQRAEWTRMTREAFPNLVRYTAEEKKRGAMVSWFKLDENSADGEIERQIAHYQSLGMSMEWTVFGHDTPADMGQRLEARGVKFVDSSALLVIDLEDAPEYYWSMPLGDIRRVIRPEEVEAVMQMEADVWQRNFDQLCEGLKMDLLHYPDLLSMYAVFEGERVLSAAWMYYLLPTSFVMLLGGSTRPEARQRGYYTALIAARAREARDRGSRYLTVDAGPMSCPILEKHGFLCLDESKEYEIEYHENQENRE